jgi:hypothetical protein
MSATVLSFPDAPVDQGHGSSGLLPTPSWRSFVTATGLQGLGAGEGMEVSEQELCRITAQRLYLIRCECGRRWFDLELPALAECPACHRLGSLAG